MEGSRRQGTRPGLQRLTEASGRLPRIEQASWVGILGAGLPGCAVILSTSGKRGHRRSRIGRGPAFAGRCYVNHIDMGMEVAGEIGGQIQGRGILTNAEYGRKQCPNHDTLPLSAFS
jgi:hypothetical protein